MDVVSHIAGRTRLKYQHPDEMHLFLKNTKNIPGLNRSEFNETTLTVLVNYEIDSPFAYVLEKMTSKKKCESTLSKEDISAYCVPLLTNPIAKAVWLMTLFGAKVGFLQFFISSMLVNKYIQAKFD